MHTALLRQSFDLNHAGLAKSCSEVGKEVVIVHERSGKGSNIGGRICNRSILTYLSLHHRSSSRHPQPIGSTRWQLPLSLIPSEALTTEHLPSSLTPHAMPSPLPSSNNLRASLHNV